MDAALRTHLAPFFSRRAVAYFERGGAIWWQRDRQADRATLAAALERSSLPQLEVAFEIEERYGGLEVDDDHQWLITVHEPIRDLPLDAWLRRAFGVVRLRERRHGMRDLVDARMVIGIAGE